MKTPRPLSDQKFNEIATQLGLSNQARAYLQRIRTGPASRRVNGYVSVKGRYASPKMRFMIQHESHRIELQRIQELELDQEVLEYYEQPESVLLSYVNHNDAKCGHHKLHDFLVIRKDEIAWEECKDLKTLEKLAREQPAQYQRDQHGVWRSPPAEAVAEKYGFKFRIWCTDLRNEVRLSNLNLLVSRLAIGVPAVPAEVAAHIKQAVHKNFGIFLSDLLKKVEDARLADVYTLLARAELRTNIDAADLARENDVRLFIDEQSLKAFSNIFRYAEPVGDKSGLAFKLECNASFYFDQVHYRILHRGLDTVIVQPEAGQPVTWKIEEFERHMASGKICASEPLSLSDSMLRDLPRGDSNDWKEANRKFDIILPCLRGKRIEKDPLRKATDRTLRRWIKAFRKAEKACGFGIFGLLPKKYLRGNRMPQLVEATVAEMVKVYTGYYKSSKAPTIAAAFALLSANCKAAHVYCPHVQTFYLFVAKQSKLAAIKDRQGKRAAAKEAPFCWLLTSKAPRHGNWAIEFGHIDHQLLDIQLRCTVTGRILGRPWLTILIDTYTRKILAFVLSFEEPSYRSCMRVIRQCVRVHQRLPQTIVVDNGVDFESNYFDGLARGCVMSIKNRPVDCPKFGSICERFFGTSTRGLIDNLAGNTKLTKNVRLVTDGFDPTDWATWTLESLTLLLHEFIFNYYEEVSHPALLTSPRQAFANSVAKMGERSNIRIPYNEYFHYLTCPAFKRGPVKINPRYGIKTNNIEYKADAFRNPQLSGKKVEGRYDPDDASLCYVTIDGNWIRCISEHYDLYKGVSEKQRQIMSDELKQRKLLHNQELPETACSKGKVLRLALNSEAVLDQKLKDLARTRAWDLQDPASKQSLESYISAATPSEQPPVKPKKNAAPAPADALASVFDNINPDAVPKFKTIQ